MFPRWHFLALSVEKGTKILAIIYELKRRIQVQLSQYAHEMGY
uniref:Uncharacterized protein n=1 Tax=Lotus japonicus TaxID=34305 RepID=I3SA71_LOTJA|nr:unknown [Lotus japonicus]